MSETWERFPVVARGLDQPTGDNRNYVVVDESGYGRMTAWVAGPARCYRTPAALEDFQPVWVEIIDHKTGERTTRFEQRTAADQRNIDRDANEYLADAGIPPQPAGWHWHVLAPPEWTPSELARAIGEASHVTEPRAVLEEIRRLYAKVLRDGSGSD